MSTRPVRVTTPGQSFDRYLRQRAIESLRPLAAGLAILFVVFALINVSELRREHIPAITVTDLALAALFAALWIALRRGLVDEDRARPLGAVLTLILHAESLFCMVVVPDLTYSVYVMLLLAGLGVYFLSYRWYVGLALALYGSWLAVAGQIAGPVQLRSYAVVLFSAAALGLILVRTRLGEHRRLYTALHRAQRELIDRRRAESALAESERRFRRFSDAVELGLVIHDGRKVVDVNQALLDLLGYEYDELVGSDAEELIAPADRDVVREGVARGGRRIYEVHAYRKDGATVPVEITGRDLGSHDAGMRVAAIRDLTRQRELENQLRQVQKLEALGRLAGGVAHDFNNLLTAINGYSELALGALPPDHPVRPEIEEIRRAGERATSLTRRLLTFNRQEAVDPRPIDLNAVVRDVDRLLRRSIGEDIELALDLAPDLGKIRVDAGQIEQVLMNLAVNARDAMPNGGRFEISTANVQIDDRRELTGLDMTPGRYVQLTASDTGHGMTEEVKNRLFEPFFTTKADGRGTGLGLSTVYGIVSQAGGQVWVQSEPGEGSTFKILLPRIDVEVESLPPERAEPAPAGSGELVLVVEDDRRLRSLTERLLADAGYRVRAANDSEEALGVLRDESVDLLLTDVVLPGAAGPELAARAVAQQPRLAVVFMSGYLPGEHALAASTNGRSLLYKPFTRERLLGAVRDALPGREPVSAVAEAESA